MNRYRDICRLFNLGWWDFDCSSNRISIDPGFAAALNMDCAEITTDELLEAIVPEQRRRMKQIITALPSLPLSNVHCDLAVGEAIFHAEVVFDAAREGAVSGCVCIRPGSAGAEPNLGYARLEGIREEIDPKSKQDSSAKVSGDIDHTFSSAASLARIGYCKWNLVTQTGSATDQWYRNIDEPLQKDLREVMSHFGHLHPEDLEVVRASFNKMERGEMQSLQYDIRVKSGDSWRWIMHNVIVTQYSPAQGCVEVAIINMDVTKYKLMEQQLTDTVCKMEELVQQRDSTLNSLSSALIYIDTDYVVQWTYTQAVESLALNRSYRKGEVCYRSVFNRDTPCEECPFGEMLRTGKRQMSHCQHENGIYIEVNTNPMYDQKGKMIGGILQMEDITVRLKRERKIKELNYVMDAILNNIPVYLFVKNPNEDFRYIYWNTAMSDYTKIPVEKVLGNVDADVFPRMADAERFRKDDLRLLANRETIEFQEEYVDATGAKRMAKTLKTLISTEDELPWILGVSWDITDLKNTEEELIKAKEKAEESDCFKSMFLANMSHEIRTPLNAIVGFAELLMDETLEMDDRQEYITIMRKNTELLLQLVSDILDLSRIESQDMALHYDDVDIHMLCGRIAAASNLQSKSKISVIFNEIQPRYVVFTDEGRVQQIITNLVNNAMKFTQEGSIQILCQLVNDNEIEISVQDTGAGIPQDKIDSIFERFVKLNSFVQGTGLGLAICKSLVEKLGGRIGVESKEGVGSRFWFTLPFTQQ